MCIRRQDLLLLAHAGCTQFGNVPLLYVFLLQMLLRVSSLTECLRLLDAQMGKDPSLMLVLEEAVRMGLEGRAGVLTHYLPAYTSTGIQRPGNQDLRTWGMSRKSLEANGPGGFVQVGACYSTVSCNENTCRGWACPL
jgi:hypothetical protein